MKNVTLDVGHRETQRSEAVTLGPTEFHLRKGIEVDGVADPVRSAGYALEAV